MPNSSILDGTYKCSRNLQKFSPPYFPFQTLDCSLLAYSLSYKNCRYQRTSADCLWSCASVIAFLPLEGVYVCRVRGFVCFVSASTVLFDMYVYLMLVSKAERFGQVAVEI